MKLKFLLGALLCQSPLLLSAQNALTYTTNSGTITITGYTGRPDNIVIPATINGYPVASIGDWAFSWCYDLTRVTIPDSVTSIGNSAFYHCSSLTRVTIPDSVTSIGRSAFTYCFRLTDVVIGNSVTSLGDFAFTYCSSLTNVVIPNSVTNIVNRAFSGCKSLTSVTIPNSVTSLGDGAFAGCASLTNVVIPDSVTSLGDWAFAECTNLTRVTIPDSVTSIGDGAFFLCASLTDVVIGNSVTSLGDAAFGWCTSLTSVTIPNSVTSIGNEAFEYCSSLTNITFLGNAPTLGDGVFDNVPGTVYYYYGTSGWGATYGGLPTVMLGAPAYTLVYITNSGTITITGYTGRPGNLVLPATINGYPVTSIGNDAFARCSSLTNVVIPGSVTSLGGSTFYMCTNLTRVRIPDSVTSIGNSAFYHCASLTSVTIPGNVTSLGDSAFGWCTSLTSVTFLGNAPTLGTGVFYNVPGTVYYYYGTSGWGATYGGLPTDRLSAPPPQISAPTVGLQAGNFGFTVTDSINHFFVVEASADLVNWQPISTNILSSPATSFTFTDSDGSNYPRRFYRVGAQLHPPPPPPPLLLVTDLSGASGSQMNFTVTVPAGTPSLVISIFGGSGDCDLYVKYGTPPTTLSWDYRPYIGGNNEAVTVSNPAAGNWYIMLYAYQAYSGVTLQVR